MSRRKALVLILLCPVAVLATGGWVLRARAERDWDRLHARIDAIQAEIDKVGTRPILHGAAQEGEAFDHYRRAIELAKQALGEPKDLCSSWEELILAPEEKLAIWHELAQKLEPALAELRSGAQAERAWLPPAWEGNRRDWATNVDLPEFWPAELQLLSAVAFHAFASELRRGRQEAALRLLLDRLQFARDLSHAPQWMESQLGAALLVTGELAAFGAQGGWLHFSEELLAEWIDTLELVDTELETLGLAFRVDTLLSVRSLAGELEEAEQGPFRWNLPLRPILSGLNSAIRYQTNEAHHLLLDFEEEYRSAFTSNPRRGPVLVRERFKSLAEEASSHLQVSLRRLEEASVTRLRALTRLRLLSYALCRQIGRTPQFARDRAGLTIQAKSESGKLRVSVDTGCAGEIELNFLMR